MFTVANVECRIVIVAVGASTGAEARHLDSCYLLVARVTLVVCRSKAIKTFPVTFYIL